MTDGNSHQGCPWWIQWWHKRQRLTDALTVIQALVERAPEGKLMPAIELFWAQDGQEHWRCPCGKKDRAAYRAAFSTEEGPE